MARWAKGERTVRYLVDKGGLEGIEAEDLGALTEALIARATLRVDTTAMTALAGGDIDGAYVAAYDAYRMAAESLLARQGLRATGGDGSHMTVEDGVSAQFAESVRLSSRSGSPSRSARTSPCCWERRMGKSDGEGLLSTI